MIITTFLNLTTVPMCNRPNHTAMSILMFLYLFILISYSFWSLGESLYSLLVLIIMVTYTSSSQLLLKIFNQSGLHFCSQSSTYNFNILYWTQSEKNRGGALRTVLMDSTIVVGNMLGLLHIHSVLAHWLTRATSSLPAPFMVSPTQTSVSFLAFTLYFYCTSSMFRCG